MALHAKDRNGWQPIHEAARNGQWKSIEFLLENGANINEVSNFGKGRSPLRLALDSLKEGHPALSYLKLHGGIDIGTEL